MIDRQIPLPTLRRRRNPLAASLDHHLLSSCPPAPKAGSFSPQNRPRLLPWCQTRNTPKITLEVSDAFLYPDTGGTRDFLRRTHTYDAKEPQNLAFYPRSIGAKVEISRFAFGEMVNIPHLFPSLCSFISVHAGRILLVSQSTSTSLEF